jgi:transcriptional regulator with XRE-family HTH domain
MHEAKSDYWPTAIKLYRRATGLTQAKLADLLDVDDRAVSRWEAGTVTPGRFYADKLQDLMAPKATVADFLLRLIVRVHGIELVYESTQSHPWDHWRDSLKSPTLDDLAQYAVEHWLWTNYRRPQSWPAWLVEAFDAAGLAW